MQLLVNFLMLSSVFMFMSSAHAGFSLNESNKLSGKEVRSVHSGNLRNCERDNGREFYNKFHPDGKLEGENDRGEDDSGTWEVNSDGDVCYSWGGTFSDGCHTIFKNPKDPKEFAYEGGSSGAFYSCTFEPIK